MTKAQAAMLLYIRRNQPVEPGETVMDCARAYEGGLAWRIADNTLGALIRRRWIAFTEDDTCVVLTDAGERTVAALAEADRKFSTRRLHVERGITSNS
jgi:hypothetical protein